MDKKLFPNCLAVIICCLFTLPLFAVPVISDECNAPAPGNFRKTAEGPGYVTVDWEPVETGASHLLTVSEVLADGSEELVYTFDGISTVTKKVEGLKQRTRYKFRIYTKCANGSPSLIPAEVDIITLIIELTLAGRKPVNPQPVGCTGIEYNNPENEWVGFRVYRFDEGKILENLFEFNYQPETNTSYIKRVINQSILIATNESGSWPNGQNGNIVSLNPFRVSEIISTNPLWIDEFGAIRIKLTTGLNPTLDICIDPSIGWDETYFYEPMVASSVEDGSTPTGNETKYNLVKMSSSDVISVNNPFNETLNIKAVVNTTNSNELQFYLIDLRGSLILDKKLNPLEDSVDINTNDIQPGIYFAKIYSGGEWTTLKLMKI